MTESGWASVAAFDALAGLATARRGPHRVQGSSSARSGCLKRSAAAASSPEDARALAPCVLRGTVLGDIACGVYRPRSLLLQGQLLDVAELGVYGNSQEARAHWLSATAARQVYEWNEWTDGPNTSGRPRVRLLLALRLAYARRRAEQRAAAPSNQRRAHRAETRTSSAGNWKGRESFIAYHLMRVVRLVWGPRASVSV